ncbi:FAD synthase [Amphibalanus amphitrite]|nr:FAD synthase-like isoform X2 [Amphibalanus amphitrite]KAF0300822.1 FAD synthase [Amphibalanus amphitrite]
MYSVLFSGVTRIRWTCLRQVCLTHCNMSTSSGTSTNGHGRSTAGVIVIGDEILKGQVKDTNSHFILKHLHSFGVRVPKVSVIPDSVTLIADEVRLFAEKFDFVITSGGIGPTHDDMTFEGVAAAFGDKTQMRPEIQKFVSEYFKTDDTSQPCFKLAQVPSTAQLVYAEDKTRGVRSRFPVVRMRNVYVLPGVPNLLEKAFLLLAKEYFVNPDSQFCCDEVYLWLDEVSAATALNQTVAECPSVTFGSYPVLYHSYYKTRITLEATDMAAVQAARARLTEALPSGTLVNYTPDPVTGAARRLEGMTQREEHVKEAVDIVNQCYDKYSPEEVCVCFNGGKDCTAVLHLAHTIQTGRHPGSRLRAVYIRESKPFPAMETFVEETRVRYDLDLYIIGGPMKAGLHAMKEHWPEVKACIMGTRQGDPYAELMRPFQPTDSDWPQLMRVNPILAWDYHQLWLFVRALTLSYCSLYDKGYTSLGSVDNTLPNPALQETIGDGTVTYRPAYELEDVTRERDGRIGRRRRGS